MVYESEKDSKVGEGTSKVSADFHFGRLFNRARNQFTASAQRKTKMDMLAGMSKHLSENVWIVTETSSSFFASWQNWAIHF